MQKREDCEVERDEEVVDKCFVTAAKMANHKTEPSDWMKTMRSQKGKIPIH